MGGTQVDCGIKDCSYYRNERCIAERISVVEEDGLVFCDTYEVAEFDIDVGPFEDEDWVHDWDGEMID